MKQLWIALLLAGLALSSRSAAQDRGITATSQSPFSRLHSVGLGDVSWTTGFWADRFRVCRDSMVPYMWHLLDDPGISHAYENFRIAAGLDTGSYQGPPFMDGDFYKWLEAAAAVYAQTHDKALDHLMDTIIRVVGKAQRSDGYLYTAQIIRGNKDPGDGKAFTDPSGFECYNLGHLMTAACIHYRATGKTDLLRIAQKAADFLWTTFQKDPSALEKTSVCPSHYMGLVELYRTTHDKRYLRLAISLLDLKGTNSGGTDQNLDRIPFRSQRRAVGHAVRANYLYAGVADILLETGDSTLLGPLDAIWKDVVYHKMYVTGGCGALYDGVSPDGTSYDPAEIQQVHQAYGRDYQLPNFTAHDETCANIGNVIWNWRMFQLTGAARYMDILELTLYNSVLSGIGLSGKDYLYANPLAVNDRLPYHLRWSKDRMPYIGLSFCCPPNVVRTIAESAGYAYSLSKNGLWLNLYGGSQLFTTTKDGASIRLTEDTRYPWDGQIRISLEKMPRDSFTVYLRIPGWCGKASLTVNDVLINGLVPGSYAAIRRRWKAGDRIDLSLPMTPQLIAANPLVEADRGQVAVKRGPLVYCLESAGLASGKNILNITLRAATRLKPATIPIAGTSITALEGTGRERLSTRGNDALYRPLNRMTDRSVSFTLIPYFAWGNRGHGDMEVWVPLSP